MRIHKAWHIRASRRSEIKTCGILLFILALWVSPARAQRAGSAQYGHHGPVLLPDPKVTPGDAGSTDAKIVCVRGYARHQRNVSVETKRRVYALYGVHASYETTKSGKRVRTCCEVDHLISLELGGSND